MFEQMSIFDEFLLDKKIIKPVRLISFFSGIEAQYKALSFLGKKLNIPVESYKTCEWAYNSILACNAIHNRDFYDYSEGKTKEEMLNHIRGISINYNEPLTDEQLSKKPLSWIKSAYNNCVANHNLINIMNVHGDDLECVDHDKFEYILTYSFPCQDLSLAGARKGMATSQADGGTRSGLLWEVERILKELDFEHRPEILLMENVPQIHSEKDYPHFEKWMLCLEELGYSNYYTDLNAKDFGVPQNRERTFMISLKRTNDGQEYNYRFPITFKRKYNLKDMLEHNVDEKYYLSKKMVDYLTGINQKESKYDRGAVFERNMDPRKEVAATITTAAGQRPTDNFIIDDLYANREERIYENESPTLRAERNGLKVVENDTILIRNATQDGYLEAEEGDGINIGSRMHHQRGNVQKGMAQTLKTKCEVGVVVDEEQNLKEQLCNELVQKGLVKEGDCVNHSYSNSRMDNPVIANREYNDCSPTLTTRPDTLGVTVDDNSLFTETEKKLFTDDGNVRRYIGSEQIDKFEEGDMATTTFPNGYGHGPRTHKDCSITLNTIDKPVVKHNLRIRKLTPTEAMRLMAFQDEDTQHMYDVGLTNMAIFHCAGDSICVNVLIGIFAKVFGVESQETVKLIEEYIETIRNH